MTQMKYLLPILILFNSCVNRIEDNHINNQKRKRYLDSLIHESQNAIILFHFQTKKESLVEKVYQDKRLVDSLFLILGEFDPDTSCFNGGVFNRFGEIVFFKDPLLRKPIAELHFVINGNCEGVYLAAEKRLLKFKLTKEWKQFIMNLYNPIKHKIE